MSPQQYKITNMEDFLEEQTAGHPKDFQIQYQFDLFCGIWEIQTFVLGYPPVSMLRSAQRHMQQLSSKWLCMTCERK